MSRPKADCARPPPENNYQLLVRLGVRPTHNSYRDIRTIRTLVPESSTVTASMAPLSNLASKSNELYAQLAQAQATYPIESPDGKYVYFVRNKRLWRVETDGSSREIVRGMPEVNYLGDEWFPAGSGIYFMSHSGGKDAIEFFDLKTERVSRVYELEKPAPGWIGGMPVSSDGKVILFPQVDEQSSNLMLIENWR